MGSDADQPTELRKLQEMVSRFLVQSEMLGEVTKVAAANMAIAYSTLVESGVAPKHACYMVTHSILLNFGLTGSPPEEPE